MTLRATSMLPIFPGRILGQLADYTFRRTMVCCTAPFEVGISYLPNNNCFTARFPNSDPEYIPTYLTAGRWTPPTGPGCNSANIDFPFPDNYQARCFVSVVHNWTMYILSFPPPSYPLSHHPANDFRACSKTSALVCMSVYCFEFIFLTSPLRC